MQKLQDRSANRTNTRVAIMSRCEPVNLLRSAGVRTHHYLHLAAKLFQRSSTPELPYCSHNFFSGAGSCCPKLSQRSGTHNLCNAVVEQRLVVPTALGTRSRNECARCRTSGRIFRTLYQMQADLPVERGSCLCE